MKPIQFPSSFLFGSATAATQIEEEMSTAIGMLGL